jgi:hypothetical protein
MLNKGLHDDCERPARLLGLPGSDNGERLAFWSAARSQHLASMHTPSWLNRLAAAAAWRLADRTTLPEEEAVVPAALAATAASLRSNCSPAQG